MSKDTKGVGCGIFPVLFGGWPKDACVWHDNAYTQQSWHQHNMSRKEVDKALLAQLLELSARGRHRFLKRLSSYAMYGVVRSFGGLWWEGDR